MALAKHRTVWSDGLIALLGILFVALSIRSAISGLSPIYEIVDTEIPLDTFARSALGTLPPVGFVLGGLLTSRLARPLGLENVLILLAVLIVSGHIIRGLATSWQMMAAGSLIALIGSGMGNVVLPPVIKRYFPGHIGRISAMYTVAMSVTSLIAPLIAVPLSDSYGWRVALISWAVVPLLATIPWILEVRRGHAEHIDMADTLGPRLRLTKAPTAWALALSLTVSSMTGYTMFAWMPAIAADNAGLDMAGGGIMLSLFAGIGLPWALLAPVLAARLRKVTWLVVLGVAFTITGSLGFVWAPTAAPYLWALTLGSGPLLFPLSLVLINLRTETTHSSLKLSAFTQFISYSGAAVAAPLMGWTHAVSGGWTVGLVGLACFSLAALWSAYILGKNRTVDQELRDRGELP